MWPWLLARAWLLAAARRRWLLRCGHWLAAHAPAAARSCSACDLAPQAAHVLLLVHLCWIHTCTASSARSSRSRSHCTPHMLLCMLPAPSLPHARSQLPNSKPMMELEAGSNVWYQAYVLKESLNEAKVRFPGERLRDLMRAGPAGGGTCDARCTLRRSAATAAAVHVRRPVVSQPQ